MAATPKGHFLPILLGLMVVAVIVGILASYVMPHRHHSLTGDGSVGQAITTRTMPKASP